MTDLHPENGLGKPEERAWKESQRYPPFKGHPNQQEAAFCAQRAASNSSPGLPPGVGTSLTGAPSHTSRSKTNQNKLSPFIVTIWRTPNH